MDVSSNEPEKHIKKKNNCCKCGENWTPGHKCEHASLCYNKIVDGKKTKVQECDEGIVVTHSEDSNYEEPSLATISCD